MHLRPTHGWGHHREGTLLGTAERNPGVSVNDVTDEQFIDVPTGTAALSGLPVTVTDRQEAAAGVWSVQFRAALRCSNDASAVAEEHGASLSVWIELAKASETDRPLDAARGYTRDVEAQIDRKKTWTYERAVEQVAQIRKLYERGGDPSGFETYLADLRHRHGQKTKFIRLLDEAGLQ